MYAAIVTFECKPEIDSKVKHVSRVCFTNIQVHFLQFFYVSRIEMTSILLAEETRLSQDTEKLSTCATSDSGLVRQNEAAIFSRVVILSSGVRK